MVFNSSGKIAVLSNKKEYKLIGGGLKIDEDPSTAFKREVLEETGCEIEIDSCLGTIKEYKKLDNSKQTSYIFISHVTKNLGILNLTKDEIDRGYTLLWVSKEKAIETIKRNERELVASKSEDNYHKKFIAKRDYEILKYYINSSL